MWHSKAESREDFLLYGSTIQGLICGKVLTWHLFFSSTWGMWKKRTGISKERSVSIATGETLTQRDYSPFYNITPTSVLIVFRNLALVMQRWIFTHLFLRDFWDRHTRKHTHTQIERAKGVCMKSCFWGLRLEWNWGRKNQKEIRVLYLYLTGLISIIWARSAETFHEHSKTCANAWYSGIVKFFHY